MESGPVLWYQFHVTQTRTIDVRRQVKQWLCKEEFREISIVYNINGITYNCYTYTHALHGITYKWCQYLIEQRAVYIVCSLTFLPVLGWSSLEESVWKRACQWLELKVFLRRGSAPSLIRHVTVARSCLWAARWRTLCVCVCVWCMVLYAALCQPTDHIPLNGLECVGKHEWYETSHTN